MTPLNIETLPSTTIMFESCTNGGGRHWLNSHLVKDKKCKAYIIVGFGEYITNNMHPLLPMDMVYLIGSFWNWKYRVQTISKQWLYRFLNKKIKLNKWKSKLRMYSYMRLNLNPPLPRSHPHIP